MGILRFFKGKNHSNDQERRQQEVNETPVETHHETDVGAADADNTTSSPPRRNSTLIRRVSSNSMRKLRRIGQALRLIGDDMERRSLGGSSTNIDAQDEEVTRNAINIITQNNTDIDVAIQNNAIINTNCAEPTSGEGDVTNTDDNRSDTSCSSDISNDLASTSTVTDTAACTAAADSTDSKRHSTEI